MLMNPVKYLIYQFISKTYLKIKIFGSYKTYLKTKKHKKFILNLFIFY